MVSAEWGYGDLTPSTKETVTAMLIMLLLGLAGFATLIGDHRTGWTTHAPAGAPYNCIDVWSIVRDISRRKTWGAQRTNRMEIIEN
jgi:hypothetical protein